MRSTAVSALLVMMGCCDSFCCSSCFPLNMFDLVLAFDYDCTAPAAAATTTTAFATSTAAAVAPAAANT